MGKINYGPESFKNRQYNKRTSGIGLSVLLNEGEEWERIVQAQLQIVRMPWQGRRLRTGELAGMAPLLQQPELACNCRQFMNSQPNAVTLFTKSKREQALLLSQIKEFLRLKLMQLHIPMCVVNRKKYTSKTTINKIMLEI